MAIEAIDDFIGHTITPKLKQFLESRTSWIISSIKMTCPASPEEYECFDKYGNQVAYLWMRYGLFEVKCPDGFSSSDTVYFNNLKGYGGFFNEDERICELSAAFDCIEEWYGKRTRLVNADLEDMNHETIFTRINPDISDQAILKKLHEYEMTNLPPKDVMVLRSKGPCIGYHEAVLGLVRLHRCRRKEYFPEADYIHGLSDEHTEAELEFFRNSGDELANRLEAVNWLFDKAFKDFEKDFRIYATLGEESLIYSYTSDNYEDVYIIDDALRNEDSRIHLKFGPNCLKHPYTKR